MEQDPKISQKPVYTFYNHSYLHAVRNSVVLTGKFERTRIPGSYAGKIEDLLYRKGLGESSKNDLYVFQQKPISPKAG